MVQYCFSLFSDLMADFPIHTEDTAPEASKPLLAGSKAAFGSVPNLHAVMAEAPGLLEAYKTSHQLFADSSFDAGELTVVWQAINVEHGCHYCVPAHTGIAKSMKVSNEITDALRDETPLPTDRLEVLRTFTLAMVRERGAVPDETTQAFLDAGYTQRQILEVILGISQKIMSNYTNHVAETPVDASMQRFAWEPATR